MTNLSTLNSCKICSTCPILDFFLPKFIKNVEFLQNTKKLYHHTIEMGDSIFFRTPCICDNDRLSTIKAFRITQNDVFYVLFQQKLLFLIQKL